MEMERIDAYLQELRQKGDIDLRRLPVVGDAFETNAPHRVGITHLFLKPRFLIADPTGSGKTPQVLVSYGFLRHKTPNLRLIVICTSSALWQWKASVLKFLNGVKPVISAFNDDGKRKKPLVRQSEYLDTNAHVLIMSYNTMAIDIEQILASTENFVVCFDEVQTVKSHKQKRLYPAAYKLSQKAKYVWGASATPIMNRLDEVYAMMNIIYPGFFGSFDHFRRTYHEYVMVQAKKRSYPQFIGYRNLEQFALLMRAYYIKRPAKVILPHLPKLTTRQVHVDMDSEQTELYDYINNEYFPGGKEHAARNLTKLASLTYLLMVGDAPSTLGLEGPSAKADELQRLLREEFFEHKVIVYTRFEKTVSFLEELLKESYNPLRITGKEAPIDREIAKQTFNDPESGRDLMLINDAGAESIDLPAASVMILYNQPWSWGKLVQIIGRARRRTSTHTNLLVVFLVNRGTIDEHVLRILLSKEILNENVFGLEEDERILTHLTEEEEGFITQLHELVRLGRTAEAEETTSEGEED